MVERYPLMHVHVHLSNQTAPGPVNTDWLPLYQTTKCITGTHLQMTSVTQIRRLISERVENMAGKKEMLVTSIFCYSHNVFKRLLSQGNLKPGIVR